MSKKTEYSLRDWLEANSIEGIAFDFDDTLIATTEIFATAVDEVLRMYAKVLPQIPPAELAQIFKEIDAVVHAKLAVNPKRWEPIIVNFERELKIKKTLAPQALQTFSEIYSKIPEFEQDVEILLEVLKRWGILLILITHANVEWTLFKLSSLGLDRTFDIVEIVDENNIHKDKTDSLRVAEKSKLPVSKIMGVGDNIRGDVQSAIEAGFGKVVWVDKKNGWHMYRQGKLPSGVLVVKKASEILQFGTK